MAIPPNELQDIILFLAVNGVVATSKYFHRHRITIRGICKKFGIIPPKSKPGRKTNELNTGELQKKWEVQDSCHHHWYTVRCSTCGKIVGSDSK